jgi:hypothetical protein
MQVPRPFCSAAVQPVRPKGADAAVVAYLQGRYGAANVDYVQTSAVAAGVEAPYDVFAISSTPGSGSIRNKWYNSTTPIVNWEEAIADNAAGEFSITSGANEFWWSTGAQAPGAVSLPRDDDTATNLWLTHIDAGATLLDGGTAPARQVMLGMSDATFDFLPPDGQQLFGQSIDWARNIPEPSSTGLLGLAEIELEYRGERQAAGIRVAKTRGVYQGRKKGTTKTKPQRARILQKTGPERS